MSARAKATRPKVSTTVAPETFAYLQSLVKGGQAASMAEALDLTVAQLREQERRIQLEAATAAYYDSLSEEEAAEQKAWGEFAGSALVQDED
ncbi:MAG TPA: hypothetical protein VNK82_11145 [Terriglobales bacterium]|nr:hypothetical protein [Terriglobales bacterium]